MTPSDSGKPANHRVAFVTSLLDVGGSTTWLCDLSGELRKRGIPVRVFSLKENHPLAAEYQEAGIDVVVQKERRLIYEERLQAALEAVRDFQPTVVVGWTGAPAYEALRYMPQGIGRVGVLHSDYPQVYEAATPYEPYMDHIAVLSQRMADVAMSSFRCGPSKIHLIRLGVEIPEASTHRDRDNAAPLRILYLGRVQQEQKRVLLFPEILRDLSASGMPFVWTIAGDGPERVRLEELMVSKSSAQVIRIIGGVPYSKIHSLLREHDVFLLASDYEGLSHTLLEAMGHGLVPVVSDIPSGMRDVVNATTGILVDVNDVPGYARAIQWLHSHRQEMTGMSRAAEQRVHDDFSIGLMTDQWLSMISSRPSTRPVWPRKFAIKRPLVHSWPWACIEPFRTVRRIAKRVSAKIRAN